MSKYRIAKIRELLATKKAYIKGYCLEPTLYLNCPIEEYCFIVICLEKTYLVPCADAPTFVLFAPMPLGERETEL